MTEKIATLGPKGTFSEKAVRQYGGEPIFKNNISEVFEFVRGGNGKGMVPVENMIDGSVGETLDLLYENGAWIVDEVIVPIKLCVAAKSENFDSVASHPKALGQCLEYIRGKELDTKETASTAKAMQMAGQDIAAIGTKLAAKEYGLEIIEENIGDKENNVTRFFVLDEEMRDGDKTSVAIHPKEDRPGLLYDLLGAFKKRGINLTKIESRPTKATLGEYIFYVDFEGSVNGDKVKEALEEVREMAKVKVFGSYPKGY